MTCSRDILVIESLQVLHRSMLVFLSKITGFASSLWLGCVVASNIDRIQMDRRFLEVHVEIYSRRRGPGAEPQTGGSTVSIIRRRLTDL